MRHVWCQGYAVAGRKQDLLSRGIGVQNAVQELCGQEPSVFEVSSETYGENFYVYVDQFHAAADCYYTLTMRQTARDTLLPLMREAAGDPDLAASFNFTKVNKPELSARSFGTLAELYDAAGGSNMLAITIPAGSLKGGLSDEAKNALLRLFRDEGYYCTFYPDGGSDGIFWYEVTRNGIWETRRTGADGGKMLDRKEYPLD